MKLIFTSFLVLAFSFVIGQTTTDFENFNLTSEMSIKDSGSDDGFTSGNLFLPNDFNSMWNSWSGWAISNETDILTPGYTNDVSAMPIGGANGTPTFAVAFGSGEIIAGLQGDAHGEVVNGLYITNNSYAYISMRDGDGFTKKFGGLTGDDPDYFLLTIKKYLDGVVTSDSVNFYLADFRFTDNSMDYIVDEWTYVDLTSLGQADSLSFSLSSTDNGVYGMNTPAYFCIDQLTTSDGTTSNENLNPLSFEIFPNPTVDFIWVKNEGLEDVNFSLYNMSGSLLLEKRITDFQDQIDVQNFPAGSYFIKIQNENGVHTQLLIKK